MIEGLPVDVSVRGTVVKRYQLTGSMEFSSQVFDVLGSQGFRIVRSGPAPVSVGKVDPKNFFIVAEKEMEV